MSTIDIETIEEESQQGYTTCPLGGLLEAHWCEEEDLLCAGERLSKDGTVNNVVAFFQLPYRIKFPEKWINIPDTKGNPYIYFRPTGTLLNTLEKRDGTALFRVERGTKFSGLKKIWNASLENDPYGLYIKTQVLISVELWGYLDTFYQEYIERIQNYPKQMLGDNVPKKKDNKPLTAEFYETKLLERIKQHSLDILNKILPAYRIACRDPFAKLMERLECFFIMNKTGRIITTSIEKSEIEYNLTQFKAIPVEGNIKRFQNRLKKKKRNYIYEEYILNALRQIELGFPALAIVQTVIILEWFANEIIQDRLTKKMERFLENSAFHEFLFERVWKDEGKPKGRGFISTEEKFNEYLPILGAKISSKTFNELKTLINKRNNIVHHIAKNEITKDEAYEAVNIGLRVIEETME